MCYYTSEVSCPYFHPLEPLVPHLWGCDGRHNAVLPLGDAWDGLCTALPGPPWKPGEDAIRSLCNLGYARGSCERFPCDAGPDAVRFAVSRDDGASVRIRYVVERDHHPFAQGPLEYSLAGETFIDPPAGEALGRQARAYVESYLRRKKEAFGR